jgi:hypothetical protein
VSKSPMNGWNRHTHTVIGGSFYDEKPSTCSVCRGSSVAKPQLFFYEFWQVTVPFPTLDKLRFRFRLRSIPLKEPKNILEKIMPFYLGRFLTKKKLFHGKNVNEKL